MTPEEFLKKYNLKISIHQTDYNPYMQRWDMDHWRVILKKDNKSFSIPFSTSFNIKRPPDISMVLNSIKLDCGSVEDSDSFDDWCRGFSYDPANKEVKRKYNACIRMAKRLKNFLGEEAYQELLTSQ